MSLEAQQPTRADQRRLGSTAVVVSSKAPWTTYYGVRNLVLVADRHPHTRLRVALRVGREFLTISLRDRRRERYALAIRGIVDGLRYSTGQRVIPAP